MLAYVPRKYEVRVKSVRYSTDEDKANLVAMDHSMLSGMDTCPTYATIRYVNSKTFAGGGRALALEAGTVCHEGFSLVRWYQLKYVENQPKLADAWMKCNFSPDRGTEFNAVLGKATSHHTNLKNLMETAVLTSGYFDDPFDKRRTIGNIIDSLSHYVDMWDFERFPNWIGPKGEIGIEVGFDLVITFIIEHDGGTTIHEVRFTGKIDGFHMDKSHHVICENKTGAMIGDAWLAQWEMSHQITGYCFSASFIMAQPIVRAWVMGLKIPVGKERMAGLAIERVNRTPMHFYHWQRWMFENSVKVMLYKDDPLSAPRFTHSCNRYFRPCGFLPLCTLSTREEQLEAIDEMVYVKHAPWEDQG